MLATLLTALLVACSGGDDNGATPTPPLVPPAWPFVFGGPAFAGGEPVPTGYTLVGRIDDYDSAAVETLEGRYLALTVGPLQEKWFGRPITFHLIGPTGSEVRAEQTEIFAKRPQPTATNTFRLDFPRLPD